MMVKTRNRISGALAIFGGLLIFLGGGTGMAGFLIEVKNIVENLMGGPNETVETIFWILIFIATLGGISVIIGGISIYKNVVVAGKILIMLGTGVGIIGLILALIMAIYRGESTEFISWLTTSLLGIGIIFSIISTSIAKRPGAK